MKQHPIRIHKRQVLRTLKDERLPLEWRMTYLWGHGCKTLEELIQLVRESDQEWYAF